MTPDSTTIEDHDGQTLESAFKASGITLRRFWEGAQVSRNIPRKWFKSVVLNTDSMLRSASSLGVPVGVLFIRVAHLFCDHIPELVPAEEPTGKTRVKPAEPGYSPSRELVRVQEHALKLLLENQHLIELNDALQAELTRLRAGKREPVLRQLVTANAARATASC